jgi:hypothetical protein
MPDNATASRLQSLLNLHALGKVLQPDEALQPRPRAGDQKHLGNSHMHSCAQSLEDTASQALLNMSCPTARLRTPACKDATQLHAECCMRMHNAR